MIRKLYFLVCFAVFTLIIACNDGKTGKSDSSADQDADKTTKALEVTADQLITSQSVGKFYIGRSMPGEQSVAPFKISKETLKTVTDEGPYEETVYFLKDAEIVLLHLKPEFDYETMQYNRKIGEIIVFSDHFRTKMGIGVGSTLEDFINIYPEYKLWYTYVSGMLVVETPELSSQFILDSKDFKGDVSKADTEITTLDIKDFRSGAKIKQVRLFKTYEE